MFGFGKTPEQKFLDAVIKVIIKAANRPIVNHVMAESFVNDHKSMFLRFYEDKDTPTLAVHMAALSCCDNLLGLTSDRDEQTCPLSDAITLDIFKWSLEAYASDDPHGQGSLLFISKAQELEKYFEENGSF